MSEVLTMTRAGDDAERSDEEEWRHGPRGSV